jgi:simple sugar transport system ATP-binding protein
MPSHDRTSARGPWVTKHYGHVLALDEADFTAMPGEVVALIGDNGAGKSTLVKTLVGAIRPDQGEILVDGAVVHLASPVDARGYGIEAVYQDLALAPDLDSAANLYLGREIFLVPFLHVLNRRAMRERAVRQLNSWPRRRDPPTLRIAAALRPSPAAAGRPG